MERKSRRLDKLFSPERNRNRENGSIRRQSNDYEGKVVSWNAGGAPENVFVTCSTDKPFAKFICERATFIASLLLGRTVEFSPAKVCIL